MTNKKSETDDIIEQTSDTNEKVTSLLLERFKAEKKHTYIMDRQGYIYKVGELEANYKVNNKDFFYTTRKIYELYKTKNGVSIAPNVYCIKEVKLSKDGIQMCDDNGKLIYEDKHHLFHVIVPVKNKSQRFENRHIIGNNRNNNTQLVYISIEEYNKLTDIQKSTYTKSNLYSIPCYVKHIHHKKIIK